ncbi:MAG: ATPase, T2SS/T4P/T4SS family [Pseudomonadota bacterium]
MTIAASEGSMNVQAPAATEALPVRRTLPWPIPDYFAPVAAEDGGQRACTIELLSGRRIEGDLLAFEPEVNSVSIRVPGLAGEHRLHLDQVRMICLSTPLVFLDQIPTTEAAAAVHTSERRFTARFHDGRTLCGATRGFLKEPSGLFLFITQGDATRAVACFIPARQLQAVQIGPLLGEALTHSRLVSEDVVDAALGQQVRLRGRKLGAQLLDRGIVAPEDLKRALQAQKAQSAAKLGELLVDAGVITQAQLDDALRTQAENRSRRLGDILVQMGAVSVRQLQMAMSRKLGIPFVDAREYRVDPLALELISARIAHEYQVLPLLLQGKSLVVAVENPLTMDFAQDLRFLTGLVIVPVIANPEDLRQRIAKEYAGVQDAREAASDHGHPAADLTKVRVEDLATELARGPAPERAPEAGEPETGVTDNALVRLVNKIIMDAHAQGASDIHIETNVGKIKTRIRFRKDGDLEDYLELGPAYRNAVISRIKIMCGLDIAEHRHGQDGKISFSRYGPLPIDLRVAIVPTTNNLEDAVLRILGGVEPLPLDALGFCERDLGKIKEMIGRSYGLILVCGPTGSGKTTTLHSVLHHINRPDIKIWTAEDPVEIAQPGLRQVQINARIGWTFANAMRAFLRADPDVIMVGEMRDAETTKIGIEASLTGHLVFSTLHTNSAAESVVRLLDLGMDPFNFADALIGILSQRLARKLCSACKKAHPMSEAEIAALAHDYCIGSALDPARVVARWRAEHAHDGQLFLHEAVGCSACTNGYKGRLGVYELLDGTPEVKRLIRDRGSVPDVQQAAQDAGMRRLRQDAIEKVLSGALDLPSARAAAS